MMTGSGGGGNNKWTDEQEWERKKAHQKAMMARGKGPDARELGNGALGVSGIGTYAQQQASRGASTQPTYPTPADLPRFNSLAEKQQAQQSAFANIQKPGFGMGYSVKPNQAPAATAPIDNMLGKGVQSPNKYGNDPIGDTSDLENPIINELSRGDNGKQVGLSVDNNAAVAPPIAPTMNGNSSRGFGVMAPPRKAYGEDSRRQALAMDIKPYSKMGGKLTTGQIALKNSIILGDDEKYENQRYGAQLGAAQQVTQEGMRQGGENSRAQLTESGANSRAANQLGFDADKFQQLAELDDRKINMQQSNDDVANFMPKRLNNLYEQYDVAETPDEKSAIAAQIQSLSGSDKKSKSIVINQTGQTLSPDGMTTTDNPAVIYNQDDNSFINIPQAERTPNDPQLVTVQQSGKYSKKELETIYNTYMAGGDISGYLG